MKDMRAKLLQMSKARVVGLSALLVLAIAVFFYSDSTDKAAEYPSLLQTGVKQAKLDIIDSFPGPSGLTGWVLSQAGQQSIAYTTKDGETLITGMLISKDGRNLSLEHENRFIPKPNLISLFKDLEQAAYIAEGELNAPKKVIYVFSDANCTYCHTVWKALQPFEKVGLQVRWLQVAILGPTSMSKAIEVMNASDQTKALGELAINHGKPWTEKIQHREENNPAIAQQIRNNTQLMLKFNIAATPGLVWQDQQGAIQVKVGMPRLAELPIITGLQAQATADPALLQYR